MTAQAPIRKINFLGMSWSAFLNKASTLLKPHPVHSMQTDVLFKLQKLQSDQHDRYARLHLFTSVWHICWMRRAFATWISWPKSSLSDSDHKQRLRWSWSLRCPVRGQCLEGGWGVRHIYRPASLFLISHNPLSSLWWENRIQIDAEAMKILYDESWGQNSGWILAFICFGSQCDLKPKLGFVPIDTREENEILKSTSNKHLTKTLTRAHIKKGNHNPQYRNQVINKKAIAK